MEQHMRAYNQLLHKINERGMELAQLKEDFENISGIRYDRVQVQGGKQYDIGDKLARIMEKEEQLKALEDYKEELKKVHELEFDKVENLKQRTILKLFYLYKRPIKQIAYNMRLSEDHVKTLKRNGVKRFLELNAK